MLDTSACQAPESTREQTLSAESARALQWYAVFDGMGGEAHGERASFAAAQALLRCGNTLRWKRLPNGIERLMERINRDVQEALGGEMGGCTAAAVFIRGRHFAAVHAGDSRVYLFSGGRLTRLTQDHTDSRVYRLPGGRLERIRSHMLLRFLGMPLILGRLCEISDVMELHHGERLLLCSDGLTDMVEDAQLFRRLSAPGTPRDAAESLLADALAAGGRDNVTIVVAQVS